MTERNHHAGEEPLPSQESLTFGEFRFDPASMSLFCNGTMVSLPPRSVGVLARLLENPGTLVSRDQLLDGVWNGAFVSDKSVSEAVQVLRQALGDDSRHPAYIETVHRRGYRFVAPVVELDETGPSGTVSPAASAAPAMLRPWTRGALVGVMVAVAILAALLVYRYLLETTESGGATSIELVAEGPTFGGTSPDWSASLSPDGTRIAYVAITTGELMVRSLRDGTDRQLTERPHSVPFRYGSPMSTAWSPDGQQIAYTWKDRNPWPAIWQIRKVSADGGAPEVLLEESTDRLVLYDWSPDGESLLILSKPEGQEQVGEDPRRTQPTPVPVKNYTARLAELSVSTGAMATVRSYEEDASFGASYSADGGRIAYDKDAEGSRGVFVMARDGSREVRVSHPSLSAFEPEWSPDGRHLLFSSYDGGALSMAAVRVDGLQVQGEPFVVKEQLALSATIHSWEASGALLYTEQYTDWMIHRMGINPSTMRAVGVPELLTGQMRGRLLGDAVASRDGQRFLITASGDGVQPYVLSASGDARQRLNLPEGLIRPAPIGWAPDEQSGFFNATRRSDVAQVLLEFDLSTGQAEELHVLPRPAVELLRLSPDGSRVVVTTKTDRGDPPDLQLSILDILSGELKHLDVFGQRLKVAWSPESDQLAVLRPNGDGWEMMVVPLGGGEIRQLVHLTHEELLAGRRYDIEIAGGSPQLFQVAWSPDASWIAFTTRPPPREVPMHPVEFLAVPVDGGTPRVLFAAPAGIVVSSMEWSADGESILYASADHRTQAWVMRNALGRYLAETADETR